jgi:hypothetical protein
MPSPAYLVSKVGDPIFAAFIGLGAAATRINREEKEQGRSTQMTIDAGLRCVYQDGILFRVPNWVHRRMGLRKTETMSKN